MADETEKWPVITGHRPLFADLKLRVLSCILLKKRLWQRCFLVDFAKFLRPPFFTEHLLETASEYKITSFWKLRQSILYFKDKWLSLNFASNLQQNLNELQ